jgi:hypothetical protein
MVAQVPVTNNTQHRLTSLLNFALLHWNIWASLHHFTRLSTVSRSNRSIVLSGQDQTEYQGYPAKT